MRLLLFTLWILNGATWGESIENRSIELSKRGFEGEYLVFPEGSNVQLVYCMTITTYSKPRGMFNIGLTAGQAWELPSKSTLSNKFKDYHRRSRRELYRKLELLLARLPASYDDGDPTTEYERAYFLKENCNEAEWKCPDVF